MSARLLDALRSELDDCLGNRLRDALTEVATTDQAMDLIDKNLSPFGISVFGLDVELSLPPPPASGDGGPVSRASLSPKSRGIQVTPLPGDDGRCLLSLPLRGPLRWALRLRLSRKVFAAELRPGTPWRSFIDRLQELIGLVLTRVHTAREVQDLQKVATVAVSTGLIVHQLANLTLAMSTAARLFQEQTCMGVLQTEDADIRRLLAKHAISARELHGLVNDLRTYIARSAVNDLSAAVEDPRSERADVPLPALLLRGVELVVSCEAQFP